MKGLGVGLARPDGHVTPHRRLISSASSVRPSFRRRTNTVLSAVFTISTQMTGFGDWRELRHCQELGRCDIDRDRPTPEAVLPDPLRVRPPPTMDRPPCRPLRVSRSPSSPSAAYGSARCPSRRPDRSDATPPRCPSARTGRARRGPRPSRSPWPAPSPGASCGGRARAGRCGPSPRADRPAALTLKSLRLSSRRRRGGDGARPTPRIRAPVPLQASLRSGGREARPPRSGGLTRPGVRA